VLAIKKIKVLFLINSLAGGGAERVMLMILKHIDRDRFVPRLAVLKLEGDYLNQVPDDINTYSLNMDGFRVGKELPKLLYRLKKVINDFRPDVVFSFMWESNIINSLANIVAKREKKVLNERCELIARFKDLFGEGIKSRAALILTKYLYKRADSIVSLSAGVKRQFVNLGLPPTLITTILNPVDLSAIGRRKLEDIDMGRPYILFAGRLTPQKNVPLLLKSFAMTRDEFDVDLLILGQGEEEGKLKELVKDLKLDNRVIFKGFENNPFKYMYKAVIFVLCSNYEGLGNVIIEAMACGTPVVSTDCPYGPGELIENGVNGILVPVGDAVAIANAFKTLLRDRKLREKFVVEGMKKVRTLDIKDIVKKYEEIIYKVSLKETIGDSR
jgi:glycosyltransferase involved in cell wall biosynthesis